jgi:hypothetical protein
MKISFVHYPESTEPVYGIHLSEELPLPPRSFLKSDRRWQSYYLSRQSCLEYYAERLAEENQGRFAVELVSPQSTYRGFLEDILFLPGVVYILDWTRYAFFLEVGRCFDPVEVLRLVGERIHHYFYSENELVLENDGAITRGVPEKSGHEETVNTDIGIR